MASAEQSRVLLVTVAMLAAAVTAIAVAVAVTASPRTSHSTAPPEPPLPTDSPATPSASWSPEAGLPGLVIQLSADQQTSQTLDSSSVLTVSGHAGPRVSVRVVTGREAKVVISSDEVRGDAFAFPPRGGGRAAITITPNTGSDLTPATAAFSYGADLISDGDWEDGANIVQRGLFNDRGQYKLEIDNGHPSCSVQGTAGRVTARSSRQISAKVWYAVDCTRDGSTLKLTVQKRGTDENWFVTAIGDIGDVQPQTSTTPLTVGSKIREDGSLYSDQFYGKVDDVYLRIG